MDTTDPENLSPFCNSTWSACDLCAATNMKPIANEANKSRILMPGRYPIAGIFANRDGRMKTASCLSYGRRRQTGIRTRCIRCNAAEGDVVRQLAIVAGGLEACFRLRFRMVLRRACVSVRRLMTHFRKMGVFTHGRNMRRIEYLLGRIANRKFISSRLVIIHPADSSPQSPASPSHAYKSASSPHPYAQANPAPS